MDRESIIVLILCVVLAVALAGILIYLHLAKKKAQQTDFSVKQKSGSKNALIFIYRFYQNVPFLKKYFAKVHESVRLTYPADEVSVNKKVTRILTKSTVIAILGVLASILISRGDLYFMLTGIVVTFICIKSTTTSELRKMKRLILVQFSEFLSTLRHYYHDSHNITASLKDTLDEIPYEVGLHIQKIYDIITSPDMNYELDKYVGSEPNKYVLMFVSLCASVKEFGDQQMPDGNWLFLQDLEYLKEEINNELLGQRRNDDAFRSIPAITIIPILCVKPLEWWALSNFEGIGDYYSGIIGIVSLLIIFAVCVGCHFLVISLRDGAEAEEKDEDLWSKFAARPGIKQFLNKVINKKYTKYETYNDSLRGMGDHTGKRAFLLKQCVGATIGFLATLLVLIAGTYTSKYSSLHNWDDAFSETVTPSAEYTDNMRAVAKEYAALKKNEKDLDENALAKEIKANTQINSDTYAVEVASAVVKKLNKYHNTYFRWWELLISMLVGFIGFQIPPFYLRFRKQVIEMRKEEEVIRFQSLMLILMHMGGTTLDTILEWMERFSYCFKESVTTCRVSMASGAQQALETMKESEQHKGFRDFVDNLLSIDKVGVAKAFDEIQVDRDFYLKKRERDMVESTEKKSSKAKLLMMVPVGAMVIFYLILPMGIYMVNMFSEMGDIF